MRERIIRRAALEFKDGMYGILFNPGGKGGVVHDPLRCLTVSRDGYSYVRVYLNNKSATGIKNLTILKFSIRYHDNH